MKGLILLLLFLSQTNLFAATHYIRSGSSGNGSDWSNALPSLPSALQRGDTYYIADGSYPSYSFDDPTSGGTYITIKKATAADHGTDIGWSSSYGAGSAKFGGLSFNSNYYIVDGGKRSSLTSGYGISITMSGDVGVQIGGRQYITLRHVEIMAPNMELKATGISGTTGSPSNITLQNVYIHDLFGCPIYIIGSRNILIEGSVIARNKSTSAWHSEGIQARGVNNMTIRYSRFIASEGTGVVVSGSENSGSWQIYGNVFDNQGKGVGNGIIADNQSGSISNIYVYNNVFANFRGGNGAIVFRGGGSNRIVRNNLFFNNDWVPFAGVSKDYNYYAKCRFPFAFTPAANENAVAEDANGKYSVDQSDPFVNSAAGDFHLKAALPKRGVSVSLSGHTLNLDPDGRTRGADGVWDIGAYEFPPANQGDKTPPEVKLDSPANGSTVSGTIQVTATATDNVGVTKVEFLVNGVVTATDTAAPYGFALDTTTLKSSGDSTLQAKAYDAAGNMGVSATFAVRVAGSSDTQLPVVSVISPANYSTVSGIIQIIAIATDNVGVAKVEFLVDGKVKASDTVAPYAFVLDTNTLRSNGNHSLQARAYDAAGNMGASSLINVAVLNGEDTVPPSVKIVSPKAETTVSGSFSVIPWIWDNSGKVAKVEFSVDNALMATATQEPFSISLDSRKLSDGPHLLTAKATDAAGNVTVSKAVSLIVKNNGIVPSPSPTVPPIVKLTSPANYSTVSGSVQVTGEATGKGGISKVEFLVNGAVKATDIAAPYSFALDTTTLANNANHTLQARAYDAAGDVGLSSVFTIAVLNGQDTAPPSVRITSPKPGAIVSGSVTVIPWVWDNSHKVPKVEFFVDYQLKGSSTQEPFSISLDSTKLPDGWHMLMARATDAAGNVTVSEPVGFTVKNSPQPSPSPTVSPSPKPTVSPSPRPTVSPSPSPSPSPVPVGTAHYIRAGASGKKDGSDWANAYSQFPAKLQRGHTYYVASGSYGGRSFNDPESGQTLITIKKATASDHGTSVGWNSSYGSGAAQFSYVYFGNSYYLFDGQTRGGDWRSGYGFRIVTSGDKGIEFKSQPALTRITLKNFEIQGRGVDNKGYDDGLYSLEDPKTGLGPTNITVSNCYVHDLGRAPFIIRYMNGFTLEKCWIARNSSNSAVHSEGLSDNGSDNVTIRYNYWEDIEGTAFIVSLSGGKVDNWQIYGNVLFYSQNNPTGRDGVGDGAIGAINDAVPTNWKIHNNTFVGIIGYSARVTYYNSGSGNQSYNNLWVDCAIADNKGDSNFNTYINTKHNSEPNSVNASGDPFVSRSGKDFHLKASTAAGTKLASPFNVDMDGVTRGADGVWDRGAFEKSAR